eukprot:Skav227161  [mRNA]  locus=scaffold502:180634:185295:- [translate_table: standard]
MVEGCAGIGVVAQGYAAAGVTVMTMIEQNIHFAEWLRTKGHAEVVRANIHDLDTAYEVAQRLQGQGFILGAGVSCQPFSAFGDRQEYKDERSISLPGTLELGYFTRASAIVLECTKEAAESKWVQSLLQEFRSATNYNIRQKILDLHHTFPARRQRWWCILVHPSFPIGDIPDMPSHRFDPIIIHVIPRSLQLEESTKQALELDDFEESVFSQVKGGISTYVIDTWKQLPTATHSWGSQLTGCPCQCRPFGFSMQRIEKRGLHGVLVPMESTDPMHSNPTKFRHLAAEEVAVLHGLPPTYVHEQSCKQAKLTLAGVGQMAAPLQGAWVVSNMKYQISITYSNMQTVHPRKVLADLCRAVLQDRNVYWPPPATVMMRIFENEIEALDHPRTFPTEEEISQAFTAHANMTHRKGETSSGGSIVLSHQAGGVHGFESGTDSTSHAHEAFASDHSRPDHPHPKHVTPGQDTFMPDPSNAHPSNGHSRTDHLETTPEEHSHEHAHDHSRTHHLMESMPDRSTDRNTYSASDHSRTIHPMQHGECSNDIATSEPMPSEPTKPVHSIGPSSPVPADHSSIDHHHDLPTHDRHEIEQESIVDQQLLEFFSSQVSEEPAHKKPRIAQPMESHSQSLDEVDIDYERHDNFDYNETDHTCWVVLPKELPLKIKFKPGTTVGQLCAAETTIHDWEPSAIKPMSIVGMQVQQSQELQQNMIIVLRTPPALDDDQCPCKTDRVQEPTLTNMPRDLACWHQRGWVATDEMTYYLEQIHHEDTLVTQAPVVFQEDEDFAKQFSDALGDWLEHYMHSEDDNTVFQAFLHDKHWFPLEVRFQGNHIFAATTPDMQARVQTALDQVLGNQTTIVQAFVVDTRFPADCGFQTLAWIQQRSQQCTSIASMTHEQALTWRLKFIEDMCSWTSDQLQAPYQLGGANQEQAMTNAIQELIESHGVSSSRSAACAQHLIQTIGQQHIRDILASARPWADLKTHANQHSIKIVTATELKQAIDQRLQSGLPFGRKDNKKKERVKPLQPRLTADQVSIPSSVFTAEDLPVPQIQPHQLQTADRGLMVLSVEDALPYLKLTSPINKQAMAIIVLEHDDERLPARKTITKFPATCVATGEAMLVTAALYQIGLHPVSRSKGTTSMRIEESELLVIRAQVYKDQTQFDWNTFSQHPVKSLLSEPEFSNCRDAIHDVWDRQFLTMRYQKSKPAEAELFLVTMRLSKQAAQAVLESNAIQGKYYEVRTPNGRRPAEDYEVVWIPKKNLSEVTLMKQTNNHPSMVVRTGLRYGLRVLKPHARDTHKQHRPELEYIPNEAMQMFRLGPVPFNTTRMSLSKVFQSWGWPARPGQPVGQDSAHEGMFWTAMSDQAPSHWVFHCEHGDVLISKMPSRREAKPTTAMASANVEASKLTLQHLAGRAKPDNEPKGDPWAKQDPWSQSSLPSPHQLAAIEANIEKKVMDAIKPQLFRMDEDEEMAPATDQKVTALEAQVQSLQSNVQQMQQDMQQFQQQQGVHNTQVNHRIHSVQQQIESQQQGFQNALDEKMAEQLRRIEAIINKRAKTDHE